MFTPYPETEIIFQFGGTINADFEIIQPVEVELCVSAIGATGPQGPVGPAGSQGDSWQETFETVSKNLTSYPATLGYSGSQLVTITYDLGGGLEIVKTFGYSGSQLVTITLSGDTPGGIDLIKTLSYTGSNLTGVVYS